jgi:predicted esterase
MDNKSKKDKSDVKNPIHSANLLFLLGLVQNMDHSFSHSKTYRYFTQGDKKKSKRLLIALHGYGQLGKFFLKKFSTCPESFFIVTPEGPHRFYRNGYSGRVGASWMTKEAREDDIKDNINWLNALLLKVKEDASFEEIYLLGFSQGGATAARWFYDQPNRFNQLILWSSVFPPDINTSMLTNGHNNSYVVGTNDEFINEHQRNEEVSFYEGIGFSTHIYDGNHDIDAITLNKLLQ